MRRILDGLASVARKQVQDAGKMHIPGLLMIKKTRVRPATPECVRRLFGKEFVVVKAKPEKTIVRAYCLKKLQNRFAEHC